MVRILGMHQVYLEPAGTNETSCPPNGLITSRQRDYLRSLNISHSLPYNANEPARIIMHTTTSYINIPIDSYTGKWGKDSSVP